MIPRLKRQTKKRHSVKRDYPAFRRALQGVFGDMLGRVTKGDTTWAHYVVRGGVWKDIARVDSFSAPISGIASGRVVVTLNGEPSEPIIGSQFTPDVWAP